MFGLILGLPIALLVNRIIINAQDRKKKYEQEERLKNSLQIIRKTLAENNTRLKTTIKTIKESKVQFDIQLDISAWNVVKDDIIKHLHDSDLKKRIAYHFSRLGTLAQLNQMYLDFSIGVGSALRGVQLQRDGLKNNILNTASTLSTEIDEILPLIDDELDKGKEQF